MGRSLPFKGVLRAITKVARGTLIFTGVMIALFGILCFVVWDADFYIVRDKWETFKEAMFGDWNPDQTKHGGLFEEVDEVSLFKFSKNTGLGYVVTGYTYSSSEQVSEKRPDSQWCYFLKNENGTSRRVELASQKGADKPDYKDFQLLAPDILNELDLSPTNLDALAKASCQFISPNNS